MSGKVLNFVAATSLLLAPEVVCAQTKPLAADPSWLSTYFFYNRPDTIVVEETTPTKAQLSFYGRPPVLKKVDAKLEDKQAEPAKVGQVDIRRLRFQDADGDIFAALLCTPAGTIGPFPIAIAVHGLNSNEAQV